ncbi:SpoIIE family protein phosphatase [Roseiflexus castenholzii]|uniref:Protein serine/threonine phosphatase n=1 Tax=Roseiflexus castenholzii (strain DSM 13941 / HLO8) TaxID=383372 RepID=A7NNS9_ROSCS|nr:SpoIIE family protein phosphatase [Roseiflexus castenholzii]ABU59223.1 protein serine/threonine phosphatase [Roseiflexus castenholzii DSM 13941]
MNTITWGACNRAKQGQSISGDAWTVAMLNGNGILAAVVDGLGGGEEAARAARLAETVFRERAERPLQELIRVAHEALHTTRGAVAGLLRLDPLQSSASYIGVGNIGIYVYSRKPIKPISKNGILGYRLPTLLELTYTYDPGDLFVLYSDGVSSQFAQDLHLDIRQSPQALAEQIVHTYGKHSDDATVVVVQT